MNVKALIHITAFLLFLLPSISCSSQQDATGDKKEVPEEKTIPVIEMESGIHSGISEKSIRVARDQEALDQLMKDVYSHKMEEPEEITMKFSDEIVVGVFMGEQTSGGYELEVDKITNEKNKIVIHVTERAPADNCGTTDVLTHPYTLLLLPAINKKFVAKRTKEIYSCEEQEETETE